MTEEQHDGISSAETDLATYSRYTYDTDAAREHEGAHSAAGAHSQAAGSDFVVPARKKRHTVRNVILVLLGLIVVAVVVVAIVAYTTFDNYRTELNETLEAGQPPMDTPVLTATDHKEPFYLLAIGLDTREIGNLGPGTYSDALALMRVDLLEKKVTMVSLPRDTRWTSPVDGSIVKLNSAYKVGGASMAVQAVESVAGVDISHVMVFDMSDMQEIVDAIGGVTVTVDVEMNRLDLVNPGNAIHLDPGVQTLTGTEAQAFAGDRLGYEDDQDAHRQSNVRTLMEAVMRKVMDHPTSELPDMLKQLAPYLHTDMRFQDILEIGWQYYRSPVDGLTFYSKGAPYSGGIDEWYDDGWYCYENPQGWAVLMSVVDSGGDPSLLDLESTAITHEDRYRAAVEAGEIEPIEDESYGYYGY